MDEYIIKEIAIGRIKRVKPHVVMSEYGVGYERGLKDAIGILNATPAVDVQPVLQWISVKDRLPEDNGKYMVWYKGELDICEFDVESQTFGYTYDDYDEMYSHLVCWDDGMDKDITHWMPLPEPPKDGEQND